MLRTRILVLGANGMLGHKLMQKLSNYESFEVFGTVRSLDPDLFRYIPCQTSNIYENINVQHLEDIYQVVKKCKPDVLINCVGVIKQVPAASDPLACIYTNALFPHQLSQICRLAGIRMIHISTDCVFDGSKGDYSELDTPSPTDLYGRSKLLGEVNDGHCLTLRTSIIGHEIRGRHGLIEWFLAQNESVKGFVRHVFSGFPTVELAKILAEYIIPHPDIQGLYQLSSNPISKFELLSLVAEQYKKKIRIDADHTSFCDRSMQSTRLREILHYQPPTWAELIEQMHQDYHHTGYKIYRSPQGRNQHVSI